MGVAAGIVCGITCSKVAYPPADFTTGLELLANRSGLLVTAVFFQYNVEGM
jgi:hypothetical protein